MSFWGRIKFSLKQAFSAGQRATDAEAVDGGPFQAHQKAQIIHLATEILDGRLGLIDGSSQLLLYMGGFPEAFPHFTVLFDERQLQDVIPILGEVRIAADRFHPLPGSPDRQHWSAEVIAKRDHDRETFESSIRPQVTEACRNIVHWLNATPGAEK